MTSLEFRPHCHGDPTHCAEVVLYCNGKRPKLSRVEPRSFEPSRGEAKSAVNTFSSMSQVPERITGPIHIGQVCSTWGNFHFKTFDGDVFQLHSSCNYILTSSCRSSYTDFNIQIRRQVAGSHPTIKSIIMKLDGSVVELSKGSVIVDGKLAILPFNQAGVLIEKTHTYIKIKAKLGLVAIWNEEDSFLVELDLKYKNQTCGLCGDFNGVQLYNEFYSHGTLLLTLTSQSV
ncbi:hypothetical protein L3Q82_000412 [Scortum barcoo]|uniref:Uncharacterized protein n=1 Tax=Scortum barcoo TaxID=214431 RepID=A0ACB8XBE8_9TELE|nr:hypothetical protein L3Q82_000412 [Scortum barcoo]